MGEGGEGSGWSFAHSSLPAAASESTTTRSTYSGGAGVLHSSSRPVLFSSMLPLPGACSCRGGSPTLYAVGNWKPTKTLGRRREGGITYRDQGVGVRPRPSAWPSHWSASAATRAGPSTVLAAGCMSQAINGGSFTVVDIWADRALCTFGPPLWQPQQGEHHGHG